MIRELARYWGTDYDWRKGKAKLKALPQFVTSIDELFASELRAAFRSLR